MANSYHVLTEESQSLLVSYLQLCYNRMNIDTVRTRYERVDKAMQLEEKSRRDKIKHYYDDITMPVVKPPVRKISNFLIDIFVSNTNLFEMTSSDPERQDSVKQMNTIIEENAKTSKWAPQAVLMFKDLPKYNVGGLECDWMESSFSVVGNATDVASNASNVTTAKRAGNVLKRLDMYNTFYDTTIPISQVAAAGDFIGYIEQYTNTRLYQYLSNLKLSLGVTALMNEKLLYATGTTTSHYYRPQVHTADSAKEELSPLQQLFSGINGSYEVGTSNKEVDPTGINEVQVLYARIIPRMFKIKVPDANSVQIWKLHFINWDKLIVAEKLTNAHNIFPALLCQIDDEGIDDQVKSAAELLMPMQNLQTKMYDARIKGLKRNLSDRALYNSARIDKKHFESDDPSAKIPVKPNILNPGLDNAYRQIPFQDNLGVTMLQELGFLNGVAQRISGLNDPQQGQFQKGNKTLGEFNEIMANADDDLRTWAKLVESQLMVDLKYIIKLNILQYQTSTTISSTSQEGAVEINPMELRRAALDFKMADGLVTKESLMDLPTARGFFELLLQSPQLQAFYGEKLPNLVEYIFTSVGFDTTKFKGQNTGALTAPQPSQGAPDGQPQTS